MCATVCKDYNDDILCCSDYLYETKLSVTAQLNNTQLELQQMNKGVSTNKTCSDNYSDLMLWQFDDMLLII